MTTSKDGLAQNTHWLCGKKSSRGLTQWKSFLETQDHDKVSHPENTNNMAGILCPPLSPSPFFFYPGI